LRWAGRVNLRGITIRSQLEAPAVQGYCRVAFHDDWKYHVLPQVMQRAAPSSFLRAAILLLIDPQPAPQAL
jgi:hypothetical protein